MVLRVEVAGDPTIAELLAQVRGRAWPPTSIQTCPSRYWWIGSTPRSLTHHPLVQVMLGWQNLPGQGSDPAAGLALGDAGARCRWTPHRPHGFGVFAGRTLEPGR